MPSAFMGLNIATSALTADQMMLNAAAHNVANANTPGYSRQRVTLVPAPPYSYPAFNRSGLPGQVGTGVSVASVQRIRDGFLDVQIRQQLSLQGQWETSRDELAKVESVLPEPASSGLGDALSLFWNAWEDLAGDPSTAARTAVVEQASTLAARVNGVAGQLNTLISGLDFQVGQQVGTVNDLASRIANLNEQIQRVKVTGDNPNDLMDQRDLLMDDLSKQLAVTYQEQPDGTMTVLVGGTDLVSAGRVRTIGTVPDAAGHLVPVWPLGDPVQLGAGQIGTFVQLRDTQLVGYVQDLNTLVKGVADAVNAVHVTGVDAAGNPGGDLFTYTAGNEAGSLALSAAIASDPTKLVAAAGPNAPGDGTIAARIADLRDAYLFSGGTQSAGDFYAAIVGRIGSDSRQASEMAANQGLVVDHLNERKQSFSGVSLDEEATDMIRFQHAYQAAARVITVMDEALDTLINRTGVIGR